MLNRIFLGLWLFLNALTTTAQLPSERLKFGDLQWTFSTGGKVFSSPVLSGTDLFIGSGDGYLYALRRNSGKLKWKFKTGGPIHSTAVVHNGSVFFGSFDGAYYALDTERGREKWRFRTGGENWMGGKGYLGMKPDTIHHDDPWEFYLSSPVIGGTSSVPVLYFGSSDHNVYAVNANTGALIWKYQTGGIVHSSPAVHDDVLYIGSWDTYLYAIDARTGNLLWRFKTGDQPGMSGIQASPVVHEGVVFFGARDAHFYAVNAKDGSLKWKYAADNSWILSNAAVQNNTVYFGTSDSYLVLALDLANGAEKWRAPLKGYVYSSPTLHQNCLFVGDFTGVVYSIRLSDGMIADAFQTATHQKYGPAILTGEGKMDFMKLAEGKDLSLYSSTVEVMDELYKLGPVLGSVVVANDLAYFASADGDVYAVRLQKR
jgi:eukaryotic-like serine/threonine-protein kinase